MSQKAMLIIMDGWGLGQVPESDAILQANTPFTDSLYSEYPHSKLVTFGNEVGLPGGQMGNSEVGHLNLGAGRIVYQDLEKINVAIADGLFYTNPQLLASIEHVKKTGTSLHILGLLSDGGVHSHTSHLKAIIETCAQHSIANKLFVHAFTDGRDTDPQSGLGYIQDLINFLGATGGNLASVTGRYYAMDRDKRWERVKIAYDALVNGLAEETEDVITTIQKRYATGETDEFLMPIKIKGRYQPIQAGDAVLVFNFRTDRCREITEVLTQMDMPLFNMHSIPLHYTTMARYDQDYKNVEVMFDKDNLQQTLGEVISAAGKTQVRIAETEKYPHVSFFFSGGREEPFEGEKRLMVPSPKVATYDLQPEMSAYGVTETILVEMKTNQPDFICLNFANTDMVGHTGVFSAIVKAAETVDACVEKIVKMGLELNYQVLLTADHGNADYAINADGSPNTAHTVNLVPLFLISNEKKYNLKNGKLADIAPTILHLMGVHIPKEMTGDILITNN